MYNQPAIQNLTLILGSTEYPITLPADTRKLQISARNGAGILQLAFNSGESGTKYISIPAGATFWVDEMYLENQTIYVQSPTAGVVVEVLTFA